MTGWVEVGRDVFHRRYDPWDVSVCVVRGDDGLLLVDTRSSPREARELARDLAPFGAPVRWVVNTHAHFDHVFGNSVFGSPVSASTGSVAPGGRARVLGHHGLPAHLQRYEKPLLAAWLDDPSTAPVEGLEEVVVTPPDVLVADRATVDVGDRGVDLLHLGRGHTDHDLVVHVADADTWIVGDLVEESGPPAYGTGSFPLDWPATVSRLEALLGTASVVVPGHGAPVDRQFVAHQRAGLRDVAHTIAELHATGVPLPNAVRAGHGRWPFPDTTVADAVVDGYQQLTAPGR